MSDIGFFNWSFTKSYFVKNINIRFKSTDKTEAQICCLTFCPFTTHLESVMVMLLMWHVLVEVLDNKGPLSFINLTFCFFHCEIVWQLLRVWQLCLIHNIFHISQFRYIICICLLTFAIGDFVMLAHKHAKRKIFLSEKQTILKPIYRKE